MREYNKYFKSDELSAARHEVTSREVNGRLVLEGVVRVYWGVEHSIRIKEFDDQRPIAASPRKNSEIDFSQPRKASNQFNRHSVHQLSSQDLNVVIQDAMQTEPLQELPINNLQRQMSELNLNYNPKDVEAIGAALKKYQTMPANFDLESLVS